MLLFSADASKIKGFDKLKPKKVVLRIIDLYQVGYIELPGYFELLVWYGTVCACTRCS